MSRQKPQDWKIRQHYEREEVVDRMVENAEYREVAPTYPEGFGSRPDAINFPGDFLDLVENGAVAFHASVERWSNPLLIDDVDLDRLRESWDLVIDIDCDESFELAKATAELVISELRSHGISSVSAKFSGNRGFHIGVRGECFPERIDGRELDELYPRLPRWTIDYLRHRLEDEMVELCRSHGFDDEMRTDHGLDPYQVSDLENNWGQRHLFRMPYSLHDGSWLVSVPVDPDRVEQFEKEEATIDSVEFDHGFLDSYEEGEAAELAVQALDFAEERGERGEERRSAGEERSFSAPEEAIPERHFPPTIEKILEGLEDGRKRALLILVNFLRTAGYGWQEVERRIWDWNDRNDPPLRESYVSSQLRWHRQRDERVPPPNYDSNGYYRDMQVYVGDNLEEKVKNPVVYAYRKAGRGDSGEGGEEDVVGECPYCGKQYKREGYLERHVMECQGDGVTKVS